MFKKRKYTIILLLILWLISLFTDLSSTKRGKPPTFAIPVKIYKDGGSTEYYGLGYKVIKYVELTAEKGPVVTKIDFGTWFMKFSYPE